MESFNYIALILLIFLCIYLLTIYIIKVEYRYFEGNCLVKIDWDKDLLLIGYSIFLPVLVLQIFLLHLFVYPIKALQDQRNRNNEVDRLNGKVLKASLLAFLCLATNEIFSILFVAFNQHQFWLGYFPFNINLAINYLATIACFDCWKIMLWPWNLKPYRNGSVDKELYPMAVFPSETRHTISDRDAHTSIREPRSSTLS